MLQQINKMLFVLSMNNILIIDDILILRPIMSLEFILQQYNFLFFTVQQ